MNRLSGEACATARAIAILLRALAHALRGWLTIRLMFGRLSDEQRGLRVQIWARQMLAILGIELQLSGQPPAHGPVLLVANHISWLDILVMHAARHCRFVSKSEVRRIEKKKAIRRINQRRRRDLGEE